MVNEEKDRQFQVHVRVVGVALACVVSEILVPGKLFYEAARDGIQIDLSPTLLAALLPKQYRSSTLIPPATQARVAHTNRVEQEKKNIGGGGGLKGP